MRSKTVPTLIGNTFLHPRWLNPVGGYVKILGETFYKIQHYDAMPPFS